MQLTGVPTACVQIAEGAVLRAAPQETVMCCFKLATSQSILLAPIQRGGSLSLRFY